MMRPTRVTRGSSFCAQTALPPTSASIRIERNLDDVERLAVEADAALAVEGGALALQLHRERGQTRSAARSAAGCSEADDDVEQPLADARQPPPGGKAVGEDQPGGIEAVEVDPAGLALEEGGEIVDVRRPVVLIRSRSLSGSALRRLLEREHDLAGAEAEQMIGQAGDVVAVDRRGRPRTAPSFMPTKPTTAKPAPLRRGQRLDPRRARRRRRAPARAA